MRITHRQLEAFIQFMETGTVTAAAERMLVTQPAMSKMLAGLEIDLKLTLFQREKRRLIPTDEARLLYNEVRRLFASLSDVERFAEDLRTFRTGELRIITGSTLGLTLVADALSDFCKENPEVDVLMDMSSNVGPDVLAANVDIGFSVMWRLGAGSCSQCQCRGLSAPCLAVTTWRPWRRLGCHY